MPEGRFKSRTYRRIKTRLPSGTTVLHYKKRNIGKTICGKCGIELSGVARARVAELQKIAKTKKRPQRPFGGVLCTKCTRETIKAKARV
jgi:large subunit ribosomal protein L34e